VSVEMRHAGDPASQREVALVIEHLLADRPGDWRVSIVGSQANDRWEMKIVGPNAFERSYTLEGSADEHRPEAIRGYFGEDAAGEEGMIEDRIERWGEALERKDPGNVGSLQTGAALASP